MQRVEMEAIRWQIEGIIALLLALAGIADRACRAPYPLQAEVMALLLPAESVARGYVSGETCLPLPAPADCDAADAAGLAARFRLLALALTGVAAWLFEQCRLHDGFWPSRASFAANDPRNAVSQAPWPFDTS